MLLVSSLVSLLTTAKADSATDCNDQVIAHTCVQIVVHAHQGQALENMVVYLEPLEGQVLAHSSQEIVIGQLDKSFTPYISVSQVNANVTFVNQDDITHHIYSAGSNNKFSFKIRAGQTNAATKFTHPSEVAMGCNIHDWMSGYLLVVNTPYFGKTDSQGRVSFKLAKQGKYNIVLWHPQMQSENNRMSKQAAIVANSVFSFTLERAMAEMPLRESDDDFDFLSDY